MSGPLVSVVLPVFNEEQGVEGVLEDLAELIDEHRLPWEVIVVDDGSSDRTPELLKSWADRVRILRHAVNRGYGASLKTGVAAARGEWVAILDGDGTYPVQRLVDLWQVCRQGAAMAVGARTEPDAHIPWVRRPAKWALRKLAGYLSGYSIPDLNSGLRIFKRKPARSFLHLMPDSFSFTTTLSLSFLRSGYPVEYVSIEYERRKGKSKIRPIHDTLNFVMLILRTIIFFEPLKVFGLAGIVFMGSGLALLLYRALVERAFGVTSMVLFVTGIQLVAIGLLADLINRRTAAVPELVEQSAEAGNGDGAEESEPGGFRSLD